jgi:hypothetical protein
MGLSRKYIVLIGDGMADYRSRGWEANAPCSPPDPNLIAWPARDLAGEHDSSRVFPGKRCGQPDRFRV